jgi:hypothetical protein
MSWFRIPTIAPELVESLRINERLSILVSHLLVALMLTSFSIAIVQVGNRFMPGWDGGYLPWVAFIVTIEAMYSKRATRNLALLSRDWVTYRGAEMILLLVGLKALLYAIRDPSQLWSDIARWPEEFLSTFFTGEYLFASLFVLAIWVFGSTFAEDLAELEGDELLLENELPAAITTDRRVIRQQLVDRVILTGALLVILTALVRFDLLADFGFNPAVRAGVLHVLAYFLFALIFLSQTQFGILRTSWAIERTPLGKNLGTRWLSYSLLFLLLLSALAWILPTRYTLGLLSIIQYVFGLIMFGIVTIWGWGMLLLASLLSLIGFRSMNPQQEEGGPQLPNLPPITPSEVTPIPWLEALKSVLFWIVLLGLIAFSIHQYISQNPELLVKLRGLPMASWLRRAWLWLRSWLVGVNQAVSTAVSAGIRRLRRPERIGMPAGWEYINFRRLTPRQRVVFFYLALIRRGGEQGFARHAGQTPYEYQETLRAALEGGEEDLAGLTDAFVEARYSQHSVTSEQAGRVKRWWDGIRKRLRR